MSVDESFREEEESWSIHWKDTLLLNQLDSKMKNFRMKERRKNDDRTLGSRSRLPKNLPENQEFASKIAGQCPSAGEGSVDQKCQSMGCGAQSRVTHACRTFHLNVSIESNRLEWERRSPSSA